MPEKYVVANTRERPHVAGNLGGPVVAGFTPHEISASQVVWDFFAAHPKR